MTARRMMTRARAFVLLALTIGMAQGVAGCGSKNADSADPDPNYYKGHDFHGRNAKK